MSIKMLQLLSPRRIIKISELAELLETNPRNIPEYKKELEKIGYLIESVPGRYGGYKLVTKNIIPSLNLSKSQKEVIQSGMNYISARNDFVYRNEFTIAMSKIMSTLSSLDSSLEMTIINRFPLKMSIENIKQRYEAVNFSINNRLIINIKYKSQGNKIKDHVLHPYKLFMFNNSWFLLALNKKNFEVGYYKLNRIIEFSISNKNYEIPSSFNENDYLDVYGMKLIGEWIQIRLEVSGIYSSIVQERIYGKNQEILETDSNTIVLSVQMKGKGNICSFVLGFGESCKVLEPIWLQEEIIEITKKIQQTYK